MARPLRIDIPNHYYHVMSRGQRKNPLFFSPKDRKKYFLILNELLEKTDIEIYSYCLMSNHVHLLIYRKNYPLNLFMKRLNSKYAVYFNKKYHLVGHVFQGRYKSKIVLNDKYLIPLVNYIHFNPVKAHIVKNTTDYKYSSAKFYAGASEKNIPKIKRLSLFEETSNRVNKTKYPTYRDSVGSEKEYILFEKRKPYKKSKEKYVERRILKKDINIDAKRIANKLRVDTKKIKWIRKRDAKQKRILFIKELIKLGYNYAEIARYLDCHYSLISKILKNK